MFGLRKRFQSDPVSDIVKKDYNPHTPDVAKLQKKEQHLVFLYDDLQDKHPRFDTIAEDAKFVWWASTKPRMTLWKKNLGKLSFPVALNGDVRIKDVPQFPIRGQVFQMDTKRLIQLDAEKENGVQFNRTKISFDVPYMITVPVEDRAALAQFYKKNYDIDVIQLRGSKAHIPWEDTIEAWMYLGDSDYWLDYTNAAGRMVNKRPDLVKVETHWRKSYAGELFPSIEPYIPNNSRRTPYYYFSPKEYA